MFMVRKVLKRLLPRRIIIGVRLFLSFLESLPRNIYFLLNLFLYRRAGVLSVKNAHTFFGYYDVSPFSSTNQKILAAVYKGNFSSPHSHNRVDLHLGYFLNKEFHRIGRTSSWNWQQGARYQWLDDANDIVIYNDFREGSFCAVIYDVSQNKEVKTLARPIYAISKENNSALTLDFTRLHYFRKGYGYHNKGIETPVAKCPGGDGVWLLDISSDTSVLIIDYNEITSYRRRSQFESAYHYLNHLSYSPNGNKLLFFHIWQQDDGQRSCRLMVADSNGENLTSYAESYRASHFCWISDNEIILTGLDEDKKLRYVHINLESSVTTVLSGKFFNQDGHPSFINDKSIITDTYPDFMGFQHLNIVDYESGMGDELGRFFIPSKFKGELRCDLHPRLNHDKRMVCVDMIYKNRRAMCILPVKV